MTVRPLPRPVGGLAAALAGLLAFGAAALAERATGAGPAASAVIEEALKSLVSALFAHVWSAGAGRGAKERDRLEARADGLSFALVAAVAFAAVENLAYFAAFPEAGVLARLAWALPLHVGAAEAVALGLLARGGAPRRAALGTLGAGAAMAWHAAANVYAASGAAGGAGPGALAPASIAFVAAAVALGAAFRRKAYIGGLLHGA